MRLYDNPGSSNALKVRYLLADLGLDYERVEIPLTRPRPPEYLALNPVGLVPALDDAGVIVTESNTILRYLARREGRGDLYPTDAVGQARVDEMLDRFSMFLRPALYSVERPALGLGTEVDAAKAADALTKIGETLRTFDGLVSDEGTALPALSIADFAAAPALWRSARVGIDLTPYPRLERWRETITARPSFAAAGPVR